MSANSAAAKDVLKSFYGESLSSKLRGKVQRLAGTFGLEIRKKSFVPVFTWDEAHRFLYYQRLFNMVKDVPGDIVECGVGPGRSFLMFAYMIRDEMKGRKLWGFDSFEGYPELDNVDREGVLKREKGMGKHSITMPQMALTKSGIGGDFIGTQVTLVKGYFEKSLKQYRGGQIALLHLDANLYEGYITSLKELYPLVAKGGVICFDEYMSTTDMLKYPGAQRAIEEFFGDHKKIIRDPSFGKYYFIKE